MLGKTESRNAMLFFLGVGFLWWPVIAQAQHHGGGHGMGGGIPGGSNRPTGVDEKDSLKDFRRALAVQATSEQTAEFQALVKETDAAKAVLQTLAAQGSVAAESKPTIGTELDQALQRMRSDNQKFLEGFSSIQKSGLRDSLKKVTKADSELQGEEKKLNEALGGSRSETVMASLGDALTRALKNFSDEQLALGREMGIVLAEDSDLTFNLADVKSSVSMGNQNISLTQNGVISQIAAAQGRRTFKIELTADLSELKQNITELLRAHIETSSGCGERLRILDATIEPSAPASVLLLHLHYERWSCIRVAGQTGPQELAEAEGAVEVRLTPEVQKDCSVKLTTAFSRIDATGAFAESLRSGDLGAELKEKLNDVVLPLIRAGADFDKTLPPAVRGSAVAQGTKFQEAGVGRFAITFDGQMDVSDQQVSLMVSQLNQAVFAQGANPK